MKNASWEYRPNGEVPQGHLLPDGVVRFAMKVEYDGANYSGWQRQKHSRSVQEALEACLSKVADQQIQLVCAGRTDAGVHASSQIVHFDSTANRSAKNWLLGCNSALPVDIKVCWAKSVSAQFHARFSALSRSYRYIIYDRSQSPAMFSSGLTWSRKKLDAEKMNQAIQLLVGEHDFSSFRASGCAANSPVRTVLSSSVKRISDFVVLDISANAFLQHMVRNIAGVLLEIGSSDISATHIGELLALKDRTKSAPTASPNGLYLVDVEYPQDFGFPKAVKGPSFMALLSS